MSLNEIKINQDIQSKLLVILTIIIIAVLSATIFRQLVDNTINLMGENKIKREKLEILIKKLAYLRDLDPNQLEKQVKNLEQVLPSRKPALETINSLNLMALKNGVFLGAITLDSDKLEIATEAASSTSQNFKLVFSVTGEMEKIRDFVKDLQGSAPLNKVKELSISIQKDEKGILLVDLGIEVYFQPLPKTFSPVDAPPVQLTQKEVEILNNLESFKFYPLTSLPNVTIGKEDIFKKTL